ncbi:MAG: hypothetical protein ACTSWW_12525 [Promethearchaeota archaeon]
MALSMVSRPIFTTYPKYLNKQCPLCHNRVEFLYPGRKRSIKDFHHTFSEVRYYYRCRNSSCYNYAHPFNPAPTYTFPEKKYSYSVWKWIGREAKTYNMNAAQIQRRILNEFGLTISENTIRNVMDEVDCYLSHQIDKKTKRLISDQGKILLSLDGQKPEDGEDALWLFVDLISNRVLDVQLLRSSDHITLHKCIKNILQSYDVQLSGILSDKQGSIVKMHKEYYSKVPHQYCQFHFLQNLWNFLEIKDSSMQKQLSKVIKHLPITTMSKTVTRHIPNIGTVNYREHFATIENDLRKLVKSRTKKFEKLRGITSFSRVSNYRDEIKEICEVKDPNHRITKILTRTADKLTEVLNDQKANYLGCQSLYSDFQTIRTVFNQKTYRFRSEHEQKLAELFKEVWRSIEKERKPLKSIKSFLPKKDATFVEIREQWVRLHRSYSPGLFSYYDFPVQERTNSKMEQQFGQEKQKFIARSGKPNVSRQIRVRGEYELKLQYVSKKEVQECLDCMKGSYSRDIVMKELKKLMQIQKKESGRWQTSIGGKAAMLKLFDPQDSPEKKT